MFQLLRIFSLLGPFLFEAVAAQDLVCAHHQLCNLARELLHESEHERINPLFPSAVSGGHELQVEPALLKEYYQAPYLLLASPLLSPWPAQVLQRRGPENTFVATLQVQSVTGTYPNARAHFWLYEDEVCGLSQQLQASFSEWNFKLKKENHLCGSAHLLILKKRLQHSLRGKKVILTHDALAPLLESWNIPFFILFPSGHGHELAPEIFKSLHQLRQKSPQLLWIVETEIGLIPQVAALVRPQDERVDIKISGHYPGPLYGPLGTLTRALLQLERP